MVVTSLSPNEKEKVNSVGLAVGVGSGTAMVGGTVGGIVSRISLASLVGTGVIVVDDWKKLTEGFSVGFSEGCLDGCSVGSFDCVCACNKM